MRRLSALAALLFWARPAWAIDAREMQARFDSLNYQAVALEIPGSRSPELSGQLGQLSAALDGYCAGRPTAACPELKARIEALKGEIESALEPRAQSSVVRVTLPPERNRAFVSDFDAKRKAKAQDLRDIRQAGLRLLAAGPAGPGAAAHPAAAALTPSLAQAEERINRLTAPRFEERISDAVAAHAAAAPASVPLPQPRPAVPPVTLRRENAAKPNEHVLEMQRRLNDRLRQAGRPTLAEDGFFGPSTEKIICELQGKYGLRDAKKACVVELGGDVDKLIRQDSEIARGRSQELPQRGDKDLGPQRGVRMLQEKLNTIKILPRTKADGDFGPGTWERVRIFQRKNCLPGTEHLDIATWQALDGAAAGRDVSACKPKPDVRPAVERIEGESVVARPRSIKADDDVIQSIRSLPARFADKKDLLQALIWQEGGMPEKGICNGSRACGPAQITHDTYSDAELGCAKEVKWADVKNTANGAVLCAGIILENISKKYGVKNPVTLAAMYNNGTSGRQYLANNAKNLINAGDSNGQTIKHVTAISYEMCYRTGVNPLDPARISPEHRRWARYAENVAESTIHLEGGTLKPECRLFPNPPKPAK